MRGLLPALLSLAAFSFAPDSSASEARRDVDAANAALAAEPPRVDGARGSLGGAIAAHDDVDAVAEAYVVLGRLDEESGAYAQALADYHAAAAAEPGSRWAVRSFDRIEWLRSRSEGGFAPLARLERVRRDPALSADPAAVDALAHDADAFPPGQVRVDARMLVAEAWLGRMHRPDDAIEELRKVTTDPKADPLTTRLAERDLVDALTARGRIEEAVAEANANTRRLDPKFVKHVRRLIARRIVRRVAIGVLAAFAAFSIMALLRAARQRTLGTAWGALRTLAPIAALFVAFVALVGGELASKYESGNATPFLVLGAAVLPLVLVAGAWGAVGSQARAARLGRALLCAATVLAAAFVLLESIDAQYLTGFGL